MPQTYSSIQGILGKTLQKGQTIDVSGGRGAFYQEVTEVKTTPEGFQIIQLGPVVITSTGERQGGSSTIATFGNKFVGQSGLQEEPMDFSQSRGGVEEAISNVKHNVPGVPGFITPPPQAGVPIIEGPRPAPQTPLATQTPPQQEFTFDPRFPGERLTTEEHQRRLARLQQPPRVLGVGGVQPQTAKVPERLPGESIQDFTNRLEGAIQGVGQQVQGLLQRVQTEGVTGIGGQQIIPPGVQQQAPGGGFTGGQIPSHITGGSLQKEEIFTDEVGNKFRKNAQTREFELYSGGGKIGTKIVPQGAMTSVKPPTGQPSAPQGLPGEQPQPSPTPSPTPAPTPTPTLPPPPPPVVGTSEAERAKLRAEELAKTKAELETGLTKPSPFASVQEFQKLRQEQGIVQDESELSAIRNEALIGKQELRQFIPGQVGLPEAGRLGAISEAERNLNFRLEGLAIRERAVLDRLNTKNSYINTIVQLGQEDYSRAYTDYTNEFNKNLKSVELYNDKLDDEQKDALTSFTTIANLFKDKQITKLDPAISQQMDTLALKIGLPAGVFQTALASIPDEKILAPIQVDTATGKDLYFFTQSQNGTPNLRRVESLIGTGTGEAKRTDDYSKAEQFIEDNPNASREDIENELLKRTSLNVTEIDRLLESKNIIKETSLTDDQLGKVAEGLYNATGGDLFGLFGKDVEKAKEFARAGTIKVNGKDTKLSARQIQKVIELLDQKY